MAARDADLLRDYSLNFAYISNDDVAAFELSISTTPKHVDGDRSEELLIVGDDIAAFEIEATAAPHATGGGTSLPPKEPSQKSQFVSTESLGILLRPFLSSDGSLIVSGLDVVTITLKAPDTTIYNPTAVWDPVVNMWVAQLDVASFQEGEWLLYAVSDVAGALPQFLPLWWGDYVDDIQEIRQAGLGRWKIEGTTLRLYEEDGISVFKEFDLKDDTGSPSNTKVFDKDPV